MRYGSSSGGVLTPSLDFLVENYASVQSIRPNRAFLTALRVFANMGRKSGWWDILTGIYVFAAPTLEGALINVKNTSQRLIPKGAVYHAPLAGVSGDGITGYLDSNMTASQLGGVAINSHTLLIYSQSDIPGSATGEVGSSAGGANFGIRSRTNVLMQIWSMSINLTQISVKSARGLNGFVRTNSTNGFIVKNDQTTNFVGTATGFPSSKFHFLHIGGATASYTEDQLAFGFYGGALSKAQCANLYLACQIFLTSLDTIVLDDEASPLGPNCFAFENIDAVTPSGADIFQAGNLPADDTITNLNKYTETERTITWTSNAYTTVLGDRNVTLNAYTGTVNKIVTLMSPVIAGNNALQVIQKMDHTNGLVTVVATGITSNIVLDHQYDNVILVSNGTDWVNTPDRNPLVHGIPFFPVSIIYGRPWGVNLTSTQTRLKFWEMIWGDRGLGANPGEITAWAKKANDTMCGITNTLGIGCRTEYTTYRLAIGSTLVKTAYSLGYLPRNDTSLTNFVGVNRPEGWGWLDIADYYGYDTSGWDTYVDTNDTAALTTDMNIDTGPVAHNAFYVYKNQVTHVVGGATDNGSGLIRVITVTPHGVTTGDQITVRGLTGVDNATGMWIATVIDSTTVDLNGSQWGTSLYEADGALITGINRADTIFDRVAVTGSFLVCRDRIVLGPGRLCDIASADGILLDSEMDDSRGSELFEETILGLCELAHTKNYRMGMSGHPVNASTGAHNGWTKENANRIMTKTHSPDMTNILMSFTPINGDQRQFLLDQINFFNGPNSDQPIPYEKMFIQLQIGGPGQEMKLIYAEAAHNLCVELGLRGYIIVPIYATIGGSLTRMPNQVIATTLGLPVT